MPDPSVGPGQAGAHSTGASSHVSPRHPRLDPLADRYAARTHGMKSSEIRALFSVVSRPEVVSLAGGMPNIADLPLDVVGSTLQDLVLGRGLQAMQYGSGQGEQEVREAICEVMRSEIARPAASSLALLMRRPDERRCIEVASEFWLEERLR